MLEREARNGRLCIAAAPKGGRDGSCSSDHHSLNAFNEMGIMGMMISMLIYATTPLSKDVAGSQQMKRDRNSIGGKVDVHLIYACGSSEHVNFLDYSISNDDYLPGYGLTIHRISLTCNKYTQKFIQR